MRLKKVTFFSVINGNLLFFQNGRMETEQGTTFRYPYGFVMEIALTRPLIHKWRKR